MEILREYQKIGMDYALKDIGANVIKMKDWGNELLLALLLSYCSPTSFFFDGELIRGNLVTSFLGQAGSGKTTTIRKLVDWLDLGVVVSALEKPNLLYSLSLKEKSEISFGYLLDGDQEGVVVLDDSDNCSPSGYVTVPNTKMRLFCIYSDKSKIRKDLFDMNIRFNLPQKETIEVKPLVNAEMMKAMILWIQALKPENIIFTEEAERILGNEMNLMRIAVAFAALQLSSDEDFEKLYVGKKHIRRAADFIGS